MAQACAMYEQSGSDNGPQNTIRPGPPLQRMLLREAAVLLHEWGHDLGARESGAVGGLFAAALIS